MRYALNPRIDVARWGNSCVIFDADSGNTHLMGDEATEIVAILLDAHEPLSQAAIFSTLATKASRAWAEDEMVEVLDELVRMGIMAQQHV